MWRSMPACQPPTAPLRSRKASLPRMGRQTGRVTERCEVFMLTTVGEIVRGDREIFPPYLYAAYQSTIRRAPTMPLIEVPLTLAELTGPGPAISAVTPEDADLTRNAGT